MIVPSVVRRRYEDWRPYITEVQKRVEGTLVRYARNAGYIFEGRVKTLESLAEKLESGRYSQWEQIEDLYACTIAVPLPDEESTVFEYLERVFELVESRDRSGSAKDPERFRFDSTRLILRLRPPPGAVEESDATVFAVKFEVQVKTLYDFAWTKTTHALTYKSDTIDWKRYRLAAHLKAASEQIEFLLRGFDDAAQHLVESPWASIEDKARIMAFFQSEVERGTIPIEVSPKDWSRFSDNFYRALQALSGHYPSGSSRRSLAILNRALLELGGHFVTLSAQKFPRSVSLYQYSIGHLSSTLDDSKRHKQLNILKDSNLFDVFPSAASSLPGQLFSLD